MVMSVNDASTVASMKSPVPSSSNTGPNGATGAPCPTSAAVSTQVSEPAVWPIRAPLLTPTLSMAVVPAPSLSFQLATSCVGAFVELYSVVRSAAISAAERATFQARTSAIWPSYGLPVTVGVSPRPMIARVTLAMAGDTVAVPSATPSTKTVRLFDPTALS